MTNVFLIFGYGVPKDILKDENYNLYLKMVFNTIYNISLKEKYQNPLIICCGGKTDIFKPYKRTEAEEIIRFFKELSKKRFLKNITKSWIFIQEKTSLSTLENFVNSKNILENKKIEMANIYIFCEQTREKRINKLSKKVFAKQYKNTVIPIDFDTSANRYLDSNFIEKKEKQTLSHDLWALKSPQNFKKYHTVFEDKLKFLRKVGPKGHVEAIQEWWQKKLDELEK